MTPQCGSFNNDAADSDKVGVKPPSDSGQVCRPVEAVARVQIPSEA